MTLEWQDATEDTFEPLDEHGDEYHAYLEAWYADRSFVIRQEKDAPRPNLEITTTGNPKRSVYRGSHKDVTQAKERAETFAAAIDKL